MNDLWSHSSLAVAPLHHKSMVVYCVCELGPVLRTLARFCGCVRVVHVYGCLCKRKHAQQCADTDVSVCLPGCVCETFSSAHLCCTACAYNHFLLSPWRTARGGEGESSWLSHQCLECQSQCGSWNLTFVCCQRQATAIQRPTSEWVLLADLHVELQSLFVTSGKLAGWSVHVYNTHPDFERGNYGENCAYYNQVFTVIFSKVRWLHS